MARRGLDRKTGVTTAGTVSLFDYTDASKAMLSKGSLSAIGDDDGWIEIELTADSGVRHGHSSEDR